jgi:hypothetical protein
MSYTGGGFNNIVSIKFQLYSASNLQPVLKGMKSWVSLGSKHSSALTSHAEGLDYCPAVIQHGME